MVLGYHIYDPCNPPYFKVLQMAGGAALALDSWHQFEFNGRRARRIQ